MKNISIKISPSFYNRLRNNEHVGLFTNIDVVLEEKKAELPEIQPLQQGFHKLYKEEEEIYKRDAMAVETKFIADANQTRRDAFRVVGLVVEMAELGADPAAKDAAVLLREVLHNYRSVPLAPMNEVTPLIHNMIEDLHKPRYSTAVTTLKLGDAVDRLEQVNDDFNEIYAERSHSQEISGIEGKMRDIRRKVNKSFFNLSEGINSFCVAKKLLGVADAANPYWNVIVLIEGFIDQAQRVLEHRLPGSPAGSGNSGGDNDDDVEIPGHGVPTLAISSQTIVSATSMLLVAEDQATFAMTLYPAALDGIMTLSADDYNDYHDFPITAFEMDGGKAVGFTVAPPQDGMAFRQPMYVMTQARAEIIKDGKTLAILTGVVWPESFWG
ncbi:MAG: DUF6261 family protein [Tannerellaceae bacterium]|jgi:hypothetical protein|nr:DUF6261 family protein [Tannerellaceae bacterium]